MVELRLLDTGMEKMLQYRTRQTVVDASGAIVGFGDWDAWRVVETVSLPPPHHLSEQSLTDSDLIPLLRRDQHRSA